MYKMSKKVDIKLDGLFDLEVEDGSFIEVEADETDVVESNPKEREVDTEEDYVQSRDNYYKLIAQGNDAMKYVLDVAKQTDKARDFEVFGQLLKQTSEINKELIDLQIRMENLKSIERKGNPTKVTNALFVGSTADLQKLIKGNKDDGTENG
tara:strand:- start:540 stop:995 length:456 start_codon:yes stop_codon:yes gene_type:complete